MAKAVIDKKALDRFINCYGKFMKAVPEIKKDAIEAGGKALQEEVRSQVDKQGINDSAGKVKGWQELHLGSKGGYARVSPVSADTSSTWRGKTVNARQLTRWLEKGHAARKASGKNPRYRARATASVIGAGGAVVKGRLFYSWAKMKGHDKALKAAARELDRITDDWEWDGDNVYYTGSYSRPS